MFNKLIPSGSIGLTKDEDMRSMIHNHITNVLPYRAAQDNWVVNKREEFLRIIVDSIDNTCLDTEDEGRLKALDTVELRIAVKLCLALDISSGYILEILNDRSLLRRSRCDTSLEEEQIGDYAVDSIH